jgi:hypothetical protein
MITGSLRWGVSYSALLWALAVGAPQPAVAAPETVLYSFTGGRDGAYPLSELLLTKGGALIGTASQGGDLVGCGGIGCGVVFELTPPAAGSGAWKENVLYRFAGGSDGASPLAGVLMDKTGALYGGTSAGGGGQCYSYGGSFTGGSLYWGKGARIGCGTIFKLTPPAIGHSGWTESVLFSFGGKDGRSPAGVPLMDKTGALYGVTGEGGEGPCGYISYHTSHLGIQFSTGCGTIFKLTPPAAGPNAWTLTTLYRFKSKPDGAFPDGGVIFEADGSLLGTTHGAFPLGSHATTYERSSYHYGNGTVFKLTPPAGGGTVWTQTILYAFSGADGINPPGGLYRDRAGGLFGTTIAGGSLSDGVVFQLSPPPTGGKRQAETTLYNFTGGFHDGAKPTSGLIRDAATAAFYGVTGTGGGTGCAGVGCGIVFSLKPPAAGKRNWTETVLHRFYTANYGQNPQARLAIDNAGNLYGTTESGGEHLFGTAFRVSP